MASYFTDVKIFIEAVLNTVLVVCEKIEENESNSLCFICRSFCVVTEYTLDSVAWNEKLDNFMCFWPCILLHSL
jgi:hypothetical protein